MTTQTGKITNVYIEPTGSHLAADVAIGATVIPVDDAYDFNATGGQVIIDGGIALPYVSADFVADTITLAAPLTLAALRDAPVWVSPLGSTKWAMVDFDDGDEGVHAVVPMGLTDRLIDGVRDEADQETAVVDDSNGRWEVKSVDDEIPTVDGGYIDPSTLPPAVPPPVVAPGSSPSIDVTGNANSLVVEAGNVEVGTSIKYYVSTSDVGVIAPANLYADTQSTVVVVVNLPNSTNELLPNTPYYVQAVAGNAAGDSPSPSNLASDTLHSDVLASTVMAKLVAGFILAGKIQVGQAYIDANEGIVIPQPDGGVIKFPVNGSFAQITAHLVARSLNVTDNFTLNGANNQVFGQITFAEGITKPQVAPLLSSEHKSYHMFDVLGSNVYQGLMEDPTIPGNWLAPFAFFGTGVRSVTKANFTWNGDLTISGIPSAISDFQPFGGMIYASGTSRYVMLGTAANPAGTGVSWYFVTFSRSGSTLTYQGRLEIADQTALPNQPRMCYNANTGDGYVFYMNSNADHKLRCIRFTPTSTPTRDSSVIAYATALSTSYNIGGCYVGNADFGSQRIVVALKGSAQMVFTGTYNALVRQPNDEFVRAGNATVMDITYADGRFWMFDDGGNIWKHSTNKAPSGRNTVPIQARHTWYDGNATGGFHETDGGPIETLSLGARTWLRVETAAAPDTDGNPADTDKADQIRIYISSDGVAVPRLQTADGWASMTPSTNWRPKVRSFLINTTINNNQVDSAVLDQFVPDDVGGSITGPNIPAGATITSVINNGMSATMSVNATASGTFGSGTVTPTVDTRSGIFESINNGNAQPPATNGFILVARAPGAFKSARSDANGSMWVMKGDGSGRIGPWQFNNLGQTIDDFGPERPGSIIMWPGPTVPLDCAAAQGQAVPRPKGNGYAGAAGYASSTSEVYARLFSIFGTRYGAGDGTTTFNLPDYRDRVLLGVGTYATTELSNEGVAYGTRDLQHTHSTTMPDHTHKITQHDHGLGAGTTAATQSGSGVQRMTGGGQTGQSGAGIESGNVSGTNPAITTSGQAKTGANSIPFHGVRVLVKL